MGTRLQCHLGCNMQQRLHSFGQFVLYLTADVATLSWYLSLKNGTLYSSVGVSNSDNECPQCKLSITKTVQYCQECVDGVQFYLAKVLSVLSLFLVFFSVLGNVPGVLMCSLIFAWLNT